MNVIENNSRSNSTSYKGGYASRKDSPSGRFSNRASSAQENSRPPSAGGYARSVSRRSSSGMPPAAPSPAPPPASQGAQPGLKYAPSPSKARQPSSVKPQWNSTTTRTAVARPLGDLMSQTMTREAFQQSMQRRASRDPSPRPSARQAAAMAVAPPPPASGAPIDNLLSDLKAAIEKLTRLNGNATDARIRTIQEVVKKLPGPSIGSAARSPSPAAARPPSAPRRAVPPLDLTRVHMATAAGAAALTPGADSGRPKSSGRTSFNGYISSYAEQIRGRASSAPRSYREPSPGRGVPSHTHARAALRAHPVSLPPSAPSTARAAPASRAASPEPDKRPVIKEIISASGSGLDLLLGPYVGSTVLAAPPALDTAAPEPDLRWTTEDRRQPAAAVAAKKPLVSGLLCEIRRASLGSKGLYFHVGYESQLASPRSVRVIGSDRIESPVVDITPEVRLAWGEGARSIPMGHVVLYVEPQHVRRFMGLACSGHAGSMGAGLTPRHVATHVAVTAEVTLRPYPHLAETFATAARDTLFPPKAAAAPAMPQAVQKLATTTTSAASAASGSKALSGLPPPPPPPLPRGLLLRKKEDSPDSTSVATGASSSEGSTGSVSAGGPPPPPPLPAGLMRPAPVSASVSEVSSASDALSGTVVAKVGGPPPPPKLPLKLMRSGAAAREAAAVAEEKPSKPTVKLFWEKIGSPQSKGTVWGNLEQLRVELKLDFKSLEEEFEQRTHTSSALLGATTARSRAGSVGPGTSGEEAASRSRLAVLPIQRGNHVAMWLQRNKLQPAAAAEIVVDVCYGRTINACPLKLEALEGLLSVLPGVEESRELRKHFRGLLALPEDAAAAAALANANPIERFLYDVLCVPDYDERLRAVQFKLQLNERLDNLAAQLRQIEGACAEIETAEALQVVLRVVLLVGNFLNAGGKNGGAKGFSIDTLPKLKHVRSTKQRERTLLSYVAAQLLDLPKASKTPSTAAAAAPSAETAATAPAAAAAPIFSLRAALPCLDGAVKISFRETSEEIDDLRKNLGVIEVALAALPYVGEDEEAPEKDPFHRALEAFYEEALGRVQRAEGDLAAVRTRFAKLMSFLSGAAYRECQEFFVMLRDFAVDLDLAVQLENAKRTAAQLAETRRANQAKRQETQNANASNKAAVVGGVMGAPTATAAAAVVRSGVAIRGPSVQPPSTTAALSRSSQGTMLLNAVKAYSRLTPEARRTLLTEPGARGRLKALGIDRRHSIGGGDDDLSWLLRDLQGPNAAATPARFRRFSPGVNVASIRKAITSPKKVKRRGAAGREIETRVLMDAWPKPTRLELASASRSQRSAHILPSKQLSETTASAAAAAAVPGGSFEGAPKVHLRASPSPRTRAADLEEFRANFCERNEPVAAVDESLVLPAVRLESRFAAEDDADEPAPRPTHRGPIPTQVRASLYASMDSGVLFGAGTVPLSVSGGGSVLPGATRDRTMTTRPNTDGSDDQDRPSAHASPGADLLALRESCGESAFPTDLCRFPALAANWTQGMDVGASTTFSRDAGARALDLRASPPSSPPSSRNSASSPPLATLVLAPMDSSAAASAAAAPVTETEPVVPAAPMVAIDEEPVTARMLLQGLPRQHSLLSADGGNLDRSALLDLVSSQLMDDAPHDGAAAAADTEGKRGGAFVLMSPGPGLEGTIRGRLANPDHRGAEAQELEETTLVFGPILDHSALPSTPLCPVVLSPLGHPAPSDDDTLLLDGHLSATLHSMRISDGGVEPSLLPATPPPAPRPAGAPLTGRSPVELHENAAFTAQQTQSPIALSPILPALAASPEPNVASGVSGVASKSPLSPRSALRLTDNRLFRAEAEASEPPVDREELPNRQQSIASLSIAQLYTSTRSLKTFLLPSPLPAEQSTEMFHRIAVDASFVASPTSSQGTAQTGGGDPSSLHYAAPPGTTAMHLPSPGLELEMGMMRCSAASASIGTFQLRRREGTDGDAVGLSDSPCISTVLERTPLVGPAAAKDLRFTPTPAPSAFPTPAASGFSARAAASASSRGASRGASEDCAESTALLERVQRAIEDSKRMLAASNALRASQRSWGEITGGARSVALPVQQQQQPDPELLDAATSAPAAEQENYVVVAELETQAEPTKLQAPEELRIPVAQEASEDPFPVMEAEPESPSEPLPAIVPLAAAMDGGVYGADEAEAEEEGVRAASPEPRASWEPAPQIHPLVPTVLAVHRAEAVLPLAPRTDNLPLTPVSAYLEKALEKVAVGASLDLSRATDAARAAPSARKSHIRLNTVRASAPALTPARLEQENCSPAAAAAAASARAVALPTPPSSIPADFTPRFSCPSPGNPVYVEGLSPSPSPLRGAARPRSEEIIDDFVQSVQTSPQSQGQVAAPPPPPSARVALEFDSTEREVMELFGQCAAETEEEIVAVTAAVVSRPPQPSLVVEIPPEAEHPETVAGPSSSGPASRAITPPTCTTGAHSAERASSWSFDRALPSQAAAALSSGAGEGEGTPELEMQGPPETQPQQKAEAPRPSSPMFLGGRGTPEPSQLPRGPSPVTPSVSLAVSSPSFMLGGSSSTPQNGPQGAASRSPDLHMDFAPSPLPGKETRSPTPDFGFKHPSASKAPAAAAAVAVRTSARGSVDSSALLDVILEMNARMRALSPPWQESAAPVTESDEVSSIPIPGAPWDHGALGDAVQMSTLSRENSNSAFGGLQAEAEPLRASKGWASSALRELKAMSFKKRKGSTAGQEAPEGPVAAPAIDAVRGSRKSVNLAAAFSLKRPSSSGRKTVTGAAQFEVVAEMPSAAAQADGPQAQAQSAGGIFGKFRKMF